ncbi:MAG TPA: GNAT family protein [Bacillota bacterium]|nr:GNAT family protein [Bacillota bacterium]
MDIWLSRLEYCGKGYGTAALKKLVEYLRSELGIEKFLIRPSEKNIRAIRAYHKVGFIRVKDKKATLRAYLLPEFLDDYGDGDYGFEHTAVLVLE